MPNVFRNLPSVGELLESPPLQSLIDRVNRNELVNRVKQFLDGMQSQIRTAAAGVQVPSPTELALRIADWINVERTPIIVPVINATGVILHPQLGRAPLADEAIAEFATVTRGYASFNLNLATGTATPAVAAVERQLQRLTAADTGTIMSSLGGATLVSLAATAANREIVIARGEVAAIDDGSTIPGLIEFSGARLREIGTTNATRIEDYAAAVSPQTAAILQVSTSGFEVIGASTCPPLDELISFARAAGLPLIHCLTQAALIELAAYGISGVPTVGKSVPSRADLTIFPGDGFIGGPPCGIVIGRQSLIDKINQHLLFPALRANKLTLAALAATLRLYDDQDVAQRAIPVLSLLTTPLENLRQRAERLAPQIAATGIVTTEVLAGTSFIAGHELPGQSLPTMVISVLPKNQSAEAFMAALRTGVPAVIARVRGDRLIIDLRSMMPREDLELINAFTALAGRVENPPHSPPV